MYIEGFNANNNYNPIVINLINCNLASLQAIPTAHQTSDNIEYWKTQDTDTLLTISFQSRDAIYTIGEIFAALQISAGGLDNVFTVQDYSENNYTITVSKNHASLSDVHYTFSRSGDLEILFTASITDGSNTASSMASTGGSYNYSMQFPVIAISGNTGYFGVAGWRSDNSSIKTTGSITILKTVTNSNYIDPDLDPGQKGFRPTGAYTDKDRPGNGGRGSTNKKNPDYASDTVTQPGAPDESAASAVKSGFINCYKMTQAQIDKICSALYSDTMMDAIRNIIVNPLDFIVSLMVFPTQPTVGASENLKFGKWNAALTGATALGVEITGSRLSNQFAVVDMGTVDIPENWGNFLDYSQTTVELYLPFIGSVNIDVSECMGGTINVQYTVDFFTGMCVANVLCNKTVTLPSGKVLSNKPAQHSFQGNCAIQIPLSAENYGTMVGSLINAAAQAITNPVAGFGGIAQDAITGGFRPNVTSKGNIVANAGFCSVLYPYVRITRPITAEPDSYQEVMGLPSYINTTLGECDDLCVCDGIDLSGVTGATENELNKIRQLCIEGVYV